MRGAYFQAPGTLLGDIVRHRKMYATQAIPACHHPQQLKALPCAVVKYLHGQITCT